MQTQFIFRYLAVFFLLAGAAAAYSDELLNDVVAMVGNRPITQLDLDEELARIKSDKNFQSDRRNYQSQALDQLINRVIVQQVLDEEFIKVSEAQIDTYLEGEMKSYGIDSPAQFDRALRSERGITIEQYRETLRERIQLQNVMQLRVPVETPTEKQIERWYKQNRSQLGKKYKVRVIRMKYNPDDLQDELRVNNKMKEARNMALTDFDKAAGMYSDHPSRSAGGYLGWFMLYELNNAEGKEVAEMAYRVQPGGVSDIFVANKAYFLLKVDRVLTPALDDVREMVTNYVYAENQKVAYSQWLRDERKRIAIQIFIKGYQKP